MMSKIQTSKVVLKRFLQGALFMIIALCGLIGIFVVKENVDAASCGSMCNQRLSEGFPADSAAVDAAKRGDTWGAAYGAQCALWMAENGQPSVFYHEVTDEENYNGFFNLRMYGWCSTPGPYPGQVATHIQLRNHGDSITGDIWSDMYRTTNFGDIGRNSRLMKVDIEKFKNGAEVVQEADGNVYKRTVEICRCNKTATNLSGDCFADVAAGKNCGIDKFTAMVKIPGGKLTVNYIGGQDCFGAGGGKITTVVVDANEDKKAWVERKEFAGYTFNHWEGEGFDLPDSGEVDLSHGDRTVNVYYDPDQDEEACEKCKDWVPQQYRDSTGNQGWTNVVVGVINYSATNENGEWHHNGEPIGNLKNGVIWAKPTDEIQWRYCYYPGAQRTAYSTVTKDNDDPEPANMNPTVNHLNNMEFMQAYDWSNKYHVETTTLKPGEENVSYDVTRDNGDASVDVGTMPGEKDAGETYAVQQRVQPPTTANKMSTYDPGDTLLGQIWTLGGPTWAMTDDGVTHSAWNCNEQCTWVDGKQSCTHQSCSHDNDFYYNEHNYDEKQDSAEVKVPYNFWNSAHAEIANNAENRVLYAGEIVTLEKAEVNIGKRQNTVTQGEQWSDEGYATEVDNGHERLFSFLAGPEGVQWNDVSEKDAYNYGPTEEGYKIWQHGGEANICEAVNFKNGRCDVLEERDGTLNELGDMNGSTDFLNLRARDNVYNVYDEAAGNYYCVAAAVYPFTVRDDYELDANGDGAWLISKPSCRKIAKKPSFQVWGAGVFSAGDIETITSIKNNVKGLVDWHITRPNQDTRMGSWGELAVTLEGQTKEMASGAATGYQGSYSGASPWNSNWVGVGQYGGWTGDANFCLRSPLSIGNMNCSNYTGDFRETSLGDSLVAERDAWEGRFAENRTELGLTVETQTGDARLDNVTVGIGETKVYKIGGKATIAQNITYPDIAYTNMSQIPKVIIYAQEIEIDCEVTRIDAVLVAKGEVNTCNGLSADPTIIADAGAESSNNDPKRQKQLVINGAVVSGYLTLSRSFGNGAGENSMAPAELINYDSSIYLWANRQAEAAASGLFTEKTIRELAPRY